MLIFSGQKAYFKLDLNKNILVILNGKYLLPILLSTSKYNDGNENASEAMR